MIAHVAVILPAKNEERLVGRALEAMRVAVDALAAERPEVGVTVVLVADACTDRTAELARRAPGVVVLESTAARVGSARAIGVDHVLAARALADDHGGQDHGGQDHDAQDHDALWLANTDADSAVPPNWLTEQVALADRGVDVMIGTVRPDPRDLTPEQNDRWLETHLPGHPNGHVHGANLGLRASSYLAAGGFDALEEHEDNRLVDRLRRSPDVIVASDACQVLTSGRLVGRTPGGYAGYLAESL